MNTEETKKQIVDKIMNELKTVNEAVQDGVGTELEKMNKAELCSLGEIILKLVKNQMPKLEHEDENNVNDEESSSSEEETVQESRRMKPMSSKTPIYSGNPKEDLDEWIFIVNQNFRLSNIVKDDDKLRALANFVKGSPMKTLRSFLKGAKNPKVEDYFKLLQRMVPPEAKTDNLKNRLLDLRQEDDFYKFLETFQS